MTEQAHYSENELIDSGYRYAMSLCHHHENAEDLVQQAWFKLTRKYGGVENKSILFRTLRNLYFDGWRRNQIVRFEAMENTAEPAAYDAFQNHSTQQDLEQLLSTLSEREREAIYMNCVEGYSTQEIANQTETPRGTVLSMLSRAKKKLSKLVEAEREIA